MKKTGSLITGLSFLLLSCSSADKEKKDNFFPVDSFLRSQVAQVDTTLNTIRQYITVDGSGTDTIYVHRQQFRSLAKDFLDLPDISTPEYSNRYQEEKQFDETLNRVLLTYLPLKPDQELIQRQEVLIQPDPGGDKITSIIINTVKNTKDSAVQKRMLWQVDRSFQVVTTRQLIGQSPTTTTVKVVWDEE